MRSTYEMAVISIYFSHKFQIKYKNEMEKKCGANSTRCRIQNYASVKMVTFQRGRLVWLCLRVCIMKMGFSIFNLVYAVFRFSSSFGSHFICCVLLLYPTKYTQTVLRYKEWWHQNSKLCRKHQKLLFKMQKLDWKC